MVSRLTRREMLELCGALATGSLLAACGVQPTNRTSSTAAPISAGSPVGTLTIEPSATPTVSPARTTIIWKGYRQDLSEEQELQFEQDNPDIVIEFLDMAEYRVDSAVPGMIPPDITLVDIVDMPQYLARGLLLNLTSYFEASNILKPDNLAPGNAYFRANSPFEIGSGSIYGMCNQWSPDFTLFAYERVFDESGVGMPSDATVLTYQEAFDLARQLARFERGQTTVFGYDYEAGWIDRIWMNMLAELGESLYSDDFKINLTVNEAARAVAEYGYNLAVEGLTVSPTNPSPGDWIGYDFTAGKVALIQYGCWFAAMAESEVTGGKVVMLPAPTWAGVRRDPMMRGAGYAIGAPTQVPDAAWRVFEWYMGKEPAVDRAKSGWGVSALKPMYDLMPQETPFQQQVQRVLAGEVTLNTPPLQFSPYLDAYAVSVVWDRYLEQALKGNISFDELVASVEAEVNAAIQKGMERLSQ